LEHARAGDEELRREVDAARQPPRGAAGVGRRRLLLDAAPALEEKSEFARDAGRLARLERETPMLAGLIHPRGLEELDDVRAVLMELVEGPGVAEANRARPARCRRALGLGQAIRRGLRFSS
jgi:hypothetical protein